MAAFYMRLNLRSAACAAEREEQKRKEKCEELFHCAVIVCASLLTMTDGAISLPLSAVSASVVPLEFKPQISPVVPLSSEPVIPLVLLEAPIIFSFSFSGDCAPA